MPRQKGGTTSRDKTVRQTILESLDAPHLDDFSIEALVEFKKKREIYVRRVKERSEEQGTEHTPNSLLNSIDESVLRMFVIAQWVQVENVEDLTEDDLNKVIEERTTIDPEDYNLGEIERAIKDVRTDRSLKSLELQVWNLGLQ